MSKTTDALEAAVAAVIANKPADGSRPTARQRANVDKAFAAILKLIAPRIRHFVRQYGLTAFHEDAEQVCAIAVHRAIEAYDPEKAKFTTFVNWQIRGELQSLRFRMMTDQRPSAKKVDGVTVSIHAGTTTADGEETTLEALIEDEDALDRTEEAAAEHLADQASIALIDAYIEQERAAGIAQLRKRSRTRRPSTELRKARPDLPVGFRAHMPAVDPAEVEKLDERLERDREIIKRSLFESDTQHALSLDTSLTRERIRQITRRASKHMAELVTNDPRFAMLAGRAAAVAAKPAAQPTVSTAGILPAMHQPHNKMVSVSKPAARTEETLDRGTDAKPHNERVEHGSALPA
ncbi:sigma factor [Stakelama marina]|uniref:Sigma-70 family RNA polymerase sigma factor n=1 Tax=Stakelama marina TaxID=2826939 RepID=A0A8T4I8T2_9SPHN|nr:sigma factor [Stakelama marina]MBR0550910.1 sigma-70 family RNA polymerase sigma factor [Stakelama marina]